MGSAADVLIFEPTDQLGGGSDHTGACSVNPLWGGCNIWLSYQQDGNYSQIGTVKASARIGFTTADLNRRRQRQRADHRPGQYAVGRSDGSAGVLSSGTSRCRRAEQSLLCRRRDRLHETATLTGAHKYDLTYLVRGAYGTEDQIVDHPSHANSPGSMVRFSYPYDQSRIGDTVYLKFRPTSAAAAQSSPTARRSPTPSPERHWLPRCPASPTSTQL